MVKEPEPLQLRLTGHKGYRRTRGVYKTGYKGYRGTRGIRGIEGQEGIQDRVQGV